MGGRDSSVTSDASAQRGENGIGSNLGGVLAVVTRHRLVEVGDGTLGRVEVVLAVLLHHVLGVEDAKKQGHVGEEDDGGKDQEPTKGRVVDRGSRWQANNVQLTHGKDGKINPSSFLETSRYLGKSRGHSHQYQDLDGMETAQDTHKRPRRRCRSQTDAMGRNWVAVLVRKVNDALKLERSDQGPTDQDSTFNAHHEQHNKHKLACCCSDASEFAVVEDNRDAVRLGHQTHDGNGQSDTKRPCVFFVFLECVSHLFPYSMHQSIRNVQGKAMQAASAGSTPSWSSIVNGIIATPDNMHPIMSVSKNTG